MKKSVNNFAEYKKVLNFAVRFNRNEKQVLVLYTVFEVSSA